MQQKKRFEGFFWAVLSIIILALFSSRTSPLYSLLYGDYTGNEASHAMLIGKYWLQGYIPYKDLYLTGGPIYFLIQSIGWLVGERIGILCLQIINFTIYLYFTRKTLNIFISYRFSLIYTTFSIIPYIALCCGGNSSEEWCLSILSLLLWLLLKNYNKELPNNITFFLFGIFTSILLFLQWQALGIAIAGFIYFCIIIINDKKYLKIIFLIIGFLIPTFIIVSYFYSVGCLKEMLDCALIYPIKIQLDVAFKSSIVILHKLVKSIFCIPLFFSGIFYFIKREQKLGFLMILISMCCTCFFMCNDNSWVHFLIAMPIIPLTLALFGTETIKKLALNLGYTICCILICFVPLKAYINYLIDGVQDGASEFYTSFTSYLEEYPNNRWMMIDTDSSYLLEADCEPIVKYFASQTKLATYDACVATALKKYISNDWGADVLISSEHRWGKWNSNEYTLTQVYIKYRGNISIYVPLTLEKEN